MADNGVENNSGSQDLQRQIEQKVASQTAEQLKAEMEALKVNAKDAKMAIEIALSKANTQYYFQGSKEEKDSPKGKVNSVIEYIQKLFVAAKTAPEKVPAADKPAQTDLKAPILTPKSTELIKKLGEKIALDDIKDQSAPYVFDILQGITNGTIKSSEDLSRKVAELSDTLQYTSPGLFNKLQNVGVEYAKESGHEEKEAKHMFGVSDRAEGTVQDEETRNKMNEEKIANEHFGQAWHVLSGYFDEDQDRKLIESLYTPDRFVKYYKGLQEKEHSKNANLSKEEVAKKVSKDMEGKISLLFGKLYSKLDHEKPSEYFQSIEQEDIMKGIMPAKSELKRRLTRLASDLHHYKGAEDIEFYRALEVRPTTANIEVDGKQKPRTRIELKLNATKSSGADFVHYLDQIVDHYVEARKYTHNARAILLHPAEHGKSFYQTLSHFAAESSMLDFDQMMLLPDNDIFQSAFGLYNKMLAEGFAKNDWRHSATMFTPKPNQHTTQIEEDVLHQLSMMYSDRHDISESRLEAALTMAVGASRGMFLTEQEMAAHSDPHLNEKGGSTFVSYYHQDATALMAFNPQHLLARFMGGPNLLDPIFFMPVSEFKGSQAYNNHNELFDKARKYKASYLKGREALPEKTFFDKLDNIGLIGGPMQRKGWRTEWQFDSLYVNDKIESVDSNGKGTGKVSDKVNFVKSFKYFENIGYELLQDYVSKLGALDHHFAGIRDTHGLKPAEKRLVAQKKELFNHVFIKYFDKDPKDLNKYLDGIRKTQRTNILDSIRKGIAAPNDIDEAVEAGTTRAFLDQMLARVITKRIPSKVLIMDRDRFSKDGTSRYHKVMQEMGLNNNPDAFDSVMKDLIFAEQMNRRNVSLQMRAMQERNEPKENYETIKYEMSEATIKAIFEPLIAKGKITQERMNDVLKLYGHIKTNYMGDEFINKDLVPYFKNGGAADRKTKYTIALDETDLSFIPFRGGGESVLKRAVGDVAAVEEGVSKPILELVGKLRDMAINGKKDFGPVVEIITKAYKTLDGIIGPGYASEIASDIAAMTVMYMKKDTQARALMGAFGVGKFNSMAAESAGKKVGVWEWDSADIDRFFTSIEAQGIVNSTPYNIGQEPGREPVYVNVPFNKKPVRLPDKISTSKIASLFGGTIEGSYNPQGLFEGKVGKITIFGKTISIPDIGLFTRQRHDYVVWSKQLREKFGGTKMDMFFDIMNKYLPIVAFMIIWQLIKKAFDESEGKKK